MKEILKLLIGGSPCTRWSIAQTKNRETEPSGLGWELFLNYKIARDKYKPDYFLYENNKSMSPAIRAQITKELGVEPVLINSALVSAQNRQRLYWVGKRNTDDTYSRVEVEQPEDRGILLRDILESRVCWREKSYTLDANYYKTAGVYNPKRQHSYSRLMAAEPVITTPDGKSFCVAATEGKGGTLSDTLKRHRRTLVAEPVRIGTVESGEKAIQQDSQAIRVYSPDGKSVTLSAGGGGQGGKTGLYAVPFELNCATPVTFDKDMQMTVEIKGRRYVIYEVKGGQITIKGKRCPIKLVDGYYIIRKLTVTECKRLQTVPENYVFPVSSTQAYKMLGNGWTVDVIAHIMRHFAGITTDPVEVLSMYDGMSCGHLALDKLVEEITDVRIMLQQLIYLLDGEDRSAGVYTQKVNRQMNRMEESQKGGKQ